MSEIHDIPHALGFPATDTPFDNGAFDWDYEIGGVRFLSAASEEFPYSRALSKVRKEQIDQSTSPGDNSLQGWWMRSQTDWSAGAGQEYMEPVTTDGVDRQFWQSAGVDVFTRPGWVSCLPGSVELGRWTASAPGRIVRIPGGYVLAAGTTVIRKVGGTSSTATAAGTVTGITIAGSNVLVASSGKIQKAPLSGTFAFTDAFTHTGTMTSWFIKSRILIAVADKLYEHPGSIITTSTDLSVTTAKVDMKDATFAFTAATGAPASILVGGYGSSGSTIMALTVDAAGTLPTLAAPIVVAEFPEGENVWDLQSYLGTYIGIATSAGVRVGFTNDNGGLTYGPIVGAPPASAGSAQSQSFSTYDRFLHYPVADAGNGRGGLVRLDLSEIGQDQRPAWSTFTRIPTAHPVTDTVVLGARQALMLAHTGTEVVLYEAADGQDLDAGWLTTSFIRFGTLEAKLFDQVRVFAEGGMSGSLSATMLDQELRETRIGTMSTGTGTEVTFKCNLRKAETTVAIRFDFTPDEDSGPVLSAWNLRAYPSVEGRGETVALPLLNFDFERNSMGVNEGYEGRAWERWKALSTRLTNGTQVSITEKHTTQSYVAVVEDCVIRQVAPPKEAGGFGGFIEVILRQT